jgi:hypothetical protein
VLSLDETREHPPIFLDMTEEAVILYDPAEQLKRELQAVRERMSSWGSVKRLLPDGGWYWVLKPDQQPGEIIEL